MKVAQYSRQLYTIGHCWSSQSSILTVSVHGEQLIIGSLRLSNEPCIETHSCREVAHFFTTLNVFYDSQFSTYGDSSLLATTHDCRASIGGAPQVQSRNKQPRNRDGNQ